MIALLQRVSQASVSVEGQRIAEITHGLMVLIGVEQNDTHAQADRLLQRIIAYRVFADSHDKMNLSLLDVQGSLLLVPQFTLPADTRKGLRPSFTPAATPALGAELFDYLVEQAGRSALRVASGQFGATMQVALVNEGPVTFWLQT